MAVELAPYQIRVNALLPSCVDTPMWQQELRQLEALRQGAKEKLVEEFLAKQLVPHLLKPEEVAELVWLLCSPAAQHLTGLCLPVDCGLLA